MGKEGKGWKRREGKGRERMGEEGRERLGGEGRVVKERDVKKGREGI